MIDVYLVLPSYYGYFYDNMLYSVIIFSYTVILFWPFFGHLEPKFELQQLQQQLFKYCSNCSSCKLLANFIQN